MSCAVAVPNSPVFSQSIPISPFSPLSPFSRVSSSSSLSSNPFSQNLAEDVGHSDSGSSVQLRRKRPAKLDIPIQMGFGSSAPATLVPVQEAPLEEEKRDGFYSVCCKRGRRPVMEDRFSAVLDIHGDPKQAFFGIFDGHGGVKAAEYAAKNMDKNIMAEVERMREDGIEDAVKRGYMKTDSDFLKEDTSGGSCCVTALITQGDLVVSNAGDCRAVMSRGGVAEALTTDHRPSSQAEKDRIEAMGGYIDCFNGVWRIQGSLAVSRAIGDKQLKRWVIAEPETQVIRIGPKDEFLILASDGLWDKVTNQEAVDIARPLCIGSDALQPLAACKKLVELAVSRGSLDDISVMAVLLDRYLQ